MIKKWLKKILFLIFGGGMALAAPLVPVEEKADFWQTVPYFDTRTGDLDENEYHIRDDGRIHVLRKNFYGIGDDFALDVVPANYDVRGMKEVQMIGSQCHEIYVYDNTYKREKVPCADGNRSHEEWKQGAAPKTTVMKTALGAVKTHAALSQDSASIGSDQDHGSASSHSYSHTVSGSDTLLIVFASLQGSVTITGITYNSVAMTDEANTDAYRASGWSLIAPADGANTVALSYSGTDVGEGASWSWNGANQTDAVVDAIAIDRTASCASVTTCEGAITVDSTDNYVLTYCWVNFNTSGLAPSQSSTEQGEHTTSNNVDVSINYLTGVSGSNTTGCTWTTNGGSNVIQLEIAPSAGTAAAGHQYIQIIQ